MNDFQTVWNQHYPGYNPAGFMLRAAGAKNWLRFHSLPKSKRYAENDAERHVLLQRQNQLADETLGVNAPCWLMQTCWEIPEGYQDISEGQDPFKACRDYNLSFAFRFVEDDDDKAVGWNVYALQTRWQKGVFDDLLWAVANERAAPTIWMSAHTGAIFAPYDGGIDLFLPTLAGVEELATLHPDWLSPHPTGL